MLYQCPLLLFPPPLHSPSPIPPKQKPLWYKIQKWTQKGRLNWRENERKTEHVLKTCLPVIQPKKRKNSSSNTKPTKLTTINQKLRIMWKNGNNTKPNTRTWEEVNKATEKMYWKQNNLSLDLSSNDPLTTPPPPKKRKKKRQQQIKTKAQ